MNKAADGFKDKTTAPNQMWQTDFTYLKVIGWGWFCLSTIPDDHSRHVIGWKLCGSMRKKDVTLDIAPATSGCDSARVLQKPRLLRDNGSSDIAADLAGYLEDHGMKHVRGTPLQPRTQGKIERWHQNRILRENDVLEGEQDAAIAAFIDHDTNHRFRKSIGNLTPADVCLGHGETIRIARRRIKQQIVPYRSLNPQRQAA